MTKGCGLERIEFINRFTSILPGDPEPKNYCRQVAGVVWSDVNPTPVVAPRLLALSEDVAALIGLDVSDCDDTKLAAVLSGNTLLPGMRPYASAYGGHQFGNWAGQLGDGRAINLGEVSGSDERGMTLQLKGAGPTPFSRHADGRAVLRSSVREFLCSEAMFHLGVPTTRALSLVTTGERVVRDMFYDGHPQAEPGAIVCRVALSFVRFGHFELPAARGDTELLEKLLHFVIQTDFPDLWDSLNSVSGGDKKTGIYLQWFERVCVLTQQMVMNWMRVGFVHGVMNTDNMSVLGLTIDYGPYGWIDDYNPDWTPNTTDFERRRYRFEQQAVVARWNLYQLANAIYPVVQDAEALQAILAALPDAWRSMSNVMMCSKIGLSANMSDAEDLLKNLDSLLQCQATDMTLFFRLLADFDPNQLGLVLSNVVANAFYDGELLTGNIELYQQWEKNYRQLLQSEGLAYKERAHRMNLVNPWFVPRNFIVQRVIEDLEHGNHEELSTVMRLLKTPYVASAEEAARYAIKQPQWARNKPGCSTLSCSS